MSTFDPFLNDIQQTDATVPAEYADAIETAAPTINQKIVEQQQPGESWTDTLQRTLPILAATYQQKQILEIQMERARQGLPPLDPSQYGVGVSVGLSPDVKRWITYGAIGLGALLMMTRGRG